MKWFRLFSDMVPVDGRDSCSLYNFRNQCVYALNGDTYNFLKQARLMSIDELGQKFGSKNVHDLIRDLCAQQIGFIHIEPERYTDMPLEWDCSSIIQRAVVDYNDEKYGLPQVSVQLSSVLCEYLELRISKRGDSHFVTKCLSSFAGNTIRSIHLVGCYRKLANSLNTLSELFPQLTAISLYEAPSDGKKIIQNIRVAYHRHDLTSLDSGNLNNSLIVQRRFFCEALRFNPYFNRKVIIDKNGFLKNDLRQRVNFGNINSTSLIHLSKDEYFTELWRASADKVLTLQYDSLRYARLITALPRKIAKDTFIYD